MKKTRNLIIGGVVTIGVLAAIGAITVARYAAKHMERDDIPDDCECDGDCDDCDCDCALADEDYFEVECPSCGETICFDGSIDPEELACPACGEKFECLVSEEDLEALDAE